MKKVLLREFVFDRLCMGSGFFQQAESEVGWLAEPLRFSEMLGRA